MEESQKANHKSRIRKFLVYHVYWSCPKLMSPLILNSETDHVVDSHQLNLLTENVNLLTENVLTHAGSRINTVMRADVKYGKDD
jgi:hypothetical protein